MLYNLTNNAKAMHVLYNAAGKAVVIEAGATTPEPVPLRDETAIAFRRFQNRGALLVIEAIDEDGRAILKKALVPLVKRPMTLFPSPDKLAEMTPPKPIHIRDEIAEEEAKKIEPPATTPRRYNRSSHKRG